VRREHPITVRGVFYRAVSSGLFDNTDKNNYQRCVNYLTGLREDGKLEDEMFADSTRIRHRRGLGGEWTSLKDYVDSSLDSIVSRYYRNQWNDQPLHLEVFSEKDAMSTILDGVLSKHYVSFNVTRGNSSRKFLVDIAKEWKAIEKPIVCFYIGDHDPSGINIEENTFERLRELSGIDFAHSRLAATWEDFQRFQNLSIDVKETDNSTPRYLEKFQTDRALEVDAIPSDEIKATLDKAISEKIDWTLWAKTKEREEKDRTRLETWKSSLKFDPIDENE
jgi:hypothetical protein